MSKVRGLLLHICVICSLICVAAKILDWYNPYMNFTGHIWGIQMALYLSAIVLGITREYVSPKPKDLSTNTSFCDMIMVNYDRKNIKRH